MSTDHQLPGAGYQGLLQRPNGKIKVPLRVLGHTVSPDLKMQVVGRGPARSAPQTDRLGGFDRFSGFNQDFTQMSVVGFQPISMGKHDQFTIAGIRASHLDDPLQGSHDRIALLQLDVSSGMPATSP